MIEKNKDAFGKMLFDYYKRGYSFCLIERDDGLVELDYSPSNYLSEHRRWSQLQKKAIKYAKGNILDIGCGGGRHSLYLQKKGFKVLGIDQSPLAVKVCKLRGLKNARVLELKDVKTLKKIFDTFLMLGNNFGLFGSIAKAKHLLKEMAKISSEKAIIIVENLDPYKTKDPLHLNYHKSNLKRGRFPGQLKIRVRYKIYSTDWFDYLFVSVKEMKHILKGTGWRLGNLLTDKGPVYLAIIEKGE